MAQLEFHYSRASTGTECFTGLPRALYLQMVRLGKISAIPDGFIENIRHL